MLDPFVVRGRRVGLRLIEPTDYATLRLIESNGSAAITFRHRGATIPPEQYPASLSVNCQAQFVVSLTDDPSSILGYVCLYNADFRNAHAKVSLILRRDARNRGWPLEGMILFLGYVFDAFPFRKLYADVMASNLQQFGLIAKKYFVIEAELPEHEWVDEKYESLYILAFYRDAWRQVQTNSLAARLEVN